MECPGEIEVLGWMQGGLPPEALARLDRHIDQCGECLAAVAALGRMRAAVGAPPPTTERYLVGDEIARGGMGQVFAATDRVLGRKVAVKTVRDPVGAARFQREMRITARLQHPAIVPVYDAGAFADGELFYVMRHVEGRTLDQVAAEAKTLDERIAIVPAVMTAIDAVAYAHDCGVIHRDLKPANVLVGRFGETVVLDWGLAKVIGDSDDGALGLGASPDPSSALTADGAVIGTPAYMAPEQAVGEPTDARSDVYGLGAILYHVLSGAPPTRTAGAALAPLAVRAPGVPAALAAIVDGATALDPDDRYPSARDLADDLRRYLTGQLVLAHRYSPGELVRRWARRHRTALIAAAVALVAVAVIGAIAIRNVVIARDDAQAQRARAVASQARSDTQREAAEKLVSLVLDDLGKRLDAMGRLDALVDVGRAVDDYYGALPVRDGADGSDELLRRADALAILGDARLAFGDVDGADAAYAQQEQLAAQAAARRGDDRAQVTVCLAKLRRGDLARTRGDLAGARAAYAACAEVAAAAPTPAASRLREMSVQALVSLAEIDRMEGKFDDGVARVDQAAPIATALAADSGIGADRARQLVHYITEARVLLALDRGDTATARAAVEANLARAQQSVDAAPGDTNALVALAQAYESLGRVEERAQNPDAAIAALTRSRDLQQQLVDRDAGNLNWLRELGVTDDALGMVELDRGSTARAVEHLQRSHAISIELHNRAPTNLEWTRDVGVGANQLGDLERALGKPDAARPLYLESVAIHERLAADHPDNAESQRDLSIALLHLGDLDREQHRAGAVDTLTRSVTIMRSILSASDTPRARIALVSALLALSDAQPLPDRRASIEAARAVLDPVRASAGAPDAAEITQAIADIDEAWAAVAP